MADYGYAVIDNKLVRIIDCIGKIDNKLVRINDGVMKKDNELAYCYHFRNANTGNMLLSGTIVECSTDTIQDEGNSASGTIYTKINEDHSILLQADINTESEDAIKQTNYVGVLFPKDEYRYRKLFIEYKILILSIEDSALYNDIRFRAFRIEDGKELVENIPVEDSTMPIYLQRYTEIPSETILAEIDIDPKIDDDFKIIFGIDMNSASNASFQVLVTNIYAQER